jgi:DNA-binding NarL/FixJ family response regulator
MAGPAHTVLVVEDDPDTREHFARAIVQCPRLRLGAAVGSCAEARAIMQVAPPDVLLTDLQLPDGHGLDLIHDARQQLPSTQILVISVFADERTVIASVKAGASGYLLKDRTADQISAAVIELIEGGSPLSANVARYVLRLIQSPTSEPDPWVPAAHKRRAARRPQGEPPSLTEREIDVLNLLAKGFSPSEIAELLKISRHTVIAHSRSIHRKLEVSSRAEAIYEALNLGLIRMGD